MTPALPSPGGDLAVTSRPLPDPRLPEARPFWDGLRVGKLLLPACRRCGPFFYPRILCPRCHTDEVAWIEASGRGAIYSFTVAYQAFHPEFKLPPPYALALVELDEGPRVLSGLVDVEPDPRALRCGMRVEALASRLSPTT